MSQVRCHFYVRTPAGDDTYRYESVHINGPHMDGMLWTDHPPLVGDLVFLVGHGSQRVIERSWLLVSHGSMNWPHGKSEPDVPHSLDIIVEPADGPFRKEAPSDEVEA